ncbi:amino acid-binding protein [Sinorhizobium medicae]|nr:amino acid-binding protein [Sinorhizobium medicae]MDX0917497.1 amino acid-binding protein [Sinorhizobium medicae]MDX0959350.1 amino acid-binding protein [Sinorhizobium medicae]
MRRGGEFFCAAALAVAMTAPAAAADLVIAMPPWPSGQAAANILKFGIAKKFSLDAEVRELGTLNAFVGLEKGEIDIQPEVWRPNFDELVRKFVTEKGAVTLSTRAVPAWQGICATPEAAATIKTVADLGDPAKTKFLDTDGDGRGEMWIGAAEWLSTGIERARAAGYGYAANLTLVEAKEDVAMAAVDAAIATARPMVFYCYAPHHVFKLHQISRLEEPPHDPSKWKIAPPNDPLWVSKSSASTAWDEGQFQIGYATAFAKKHPEVAQFLQNVDFSPDEVTAMSYALQVERQTPVDYARKWVESHAERIDGWAK